MTGDAGKFGLGIGVGFALYLLARNFGFGKGFGFGEGKGPTAFPASFPTSSPIAKDAQRLEFVMVGPTTLTDKTVALRGPDNKIYSLDEMLARIKAGGRADVSLKIRGDVINGPATEAEGRIRQAGIAIWEPGRSPSPPLVGRGIYR